MHPIPYLSFNGNCAEAMRFYLHAWHPVTRTVPDSIDAACVLYAAPLRIA
jgi:uncharacterized glyoxalase superfamily protein PhnB